jgi:peroxiredoxin
MSVSNVIIKRCGVRSSGGRALLAAALFFLCAGQGAAQELKAPGFELNDLEGNPVKFVELLEKGPVMINFWATWCKPCIQELPHLQEIYEKFNDRGVTLLAVSVDSPRSVSKVKSFVSGHNYTFTVLLDPNKDVARKFNVQLFPYTFIVNTSGDIVFKNYGYRPGDEKGIEEKLLSLLGAETAPGKTEEGQESE